MLKKPLLLFLIFSLSSLLSYAEGPWTQKATFGGPGRHRSFGFSIGNKGYLGGGWIGVQFWDDFWEYDPATNTWTQKASLPTGGIVSPCGFAIGNKGYFTLGLDFAWQDNFNTYEFDPLFNTWTVKAPWPSFGAWGTEAFVIGNRAYAGEWGGDMYIYDQPTDQWITTPTGFNFGSDEVALSLNGKGYMATTQTGNQLWRYDPSTNSWTQRATMPVGGMTEASGFVAGGKIYVGTGQWFADGTRIKQFWEYNPVTNTWRGVNELPGAERDDATAFSIGNKGYIGTGTSGINMQDFWEFDPAYVTGVDEVENKLSVTVFPNPMKESATLVIASEAKQSLTNLQFELYDLQGKCVKQLQITDSKLLIERENLSSGTYIYKITSESKTLASGKLIVQ